MLSDLASAITGEIMYVDGGLNTTALGNADPLPTLNDTLNSTKKRRRPEFPVGVFCCEAASDVKPLTRFPCLERQTC